MEPESYQFEDAPTPPLQPTAPPPLLEQASHTRFLDLTNGAGGDPHSYDDDDDDDADDDEAIAMMRAPTISIAATPSHKKKIRADNSDPGSPLGPVVPTGHEATGRWTKQEHEAFLQGLRLYGKEWKKVAAKVRTRTVVQTRTHAQKYFQKLQKAVESGEADIDEVPMGSGSRSTSTKKKRKPVSAPAPDPSPAPARQMASAAHLLSNFSSNDDSPFAEPSMPSGVASFAKPEARATLFSSPHGFTIQTAGDSEYSYPASKPVNNFSMKIVAPEPDAASKRGKFPEPSPAACGKRKLAEIAAARMLAGVFGSAASDDGTATPPPEEEDIKISAKSIPEPPIIPAAKKPGGFGLSLQIVNPETLGVSYETEQKRRKEGGSPQTPWEGQLAALVSEKKKPENDDLGISGPPNLLAPVAMTLHPVCGPASAFGRNPLHKAVCEMNLGVIRSELSGRPSEFFQRSDSKGFCPIHSACSLCLRDSNNSNTAAEIVRMMTSAGAEVSVADSNGNTPLHWAARAGDRQTVEFLLMKAAPRDAKNDRGETPLHWALRAGRKGMDVAKALLENGAKPAIWSKEFKRPIEVAADGFHDDDVPVIELKKLVDQRKRITKEQRRVLKEAMEERKEARANLLEISSQSRTLVLHHPECLQHIPKHSSDWENPDRVRSILEKLGGGHIRQNEITVSTEFERAKLDLLSRIHSTEYLSFVNELSKDLERQQRELSEGEQLHEEPERKPPVVPFTPMVQRSMIKVAESSVKLGAHSDTSFSVGSLRAARRAAGAVQHAVDCVLIGRNRNAFCLVRPPGHHAGINGLLDGGESCGFCIFNSVAAGAMHAISDERLLCERCAIVDIDVHHGNGTEEIVRKCHDPGKLFFFSIHLYDNERKGKRETKSFQYKFYPGTGDEDDVALNIINVPIAPMWKEEKPSVAAGPRNTRHRTRQRSSRESDEGSDGGTPKGGNSDTESDAGTSRASSTPTTPNPNPSGGRVAYRKAIQNRLLPALRAFNPDLILISAGFDACKGDVGNAKHEFGTKEKMGMDLEPEDYAWTTRKILEIADICCQGRVVSVLEGGYGRTPPNAQPGDNTPLDKSAFSECALRHIHSMIDPYDTESRFGSASKE